MRSTLLKHRQVQILRIDALLAHLSCGILGPVICPNRAIEFISGQCCPAILPAPKVRSHPLEVRDQTSEISDQKSEISKAGIGILQKPQRAKGKASGGRKQGAGAEVRHQRSDIRFQQIRNSRAQGAASSEQRAEVRHRRSEIRGQQSGKSRGTGAKRKGQRAERRVCCHPERM